MTLPDGDISTQGRSAVGCPQCSSLQPDSCSQRAAVLVHGRGSIRFQPFEAIALWDIRVLRLIGVRLTEKEMVPGPSAFWAGARAQLPYPPTSISRNLPFTNFRMRIRSCGPRS